mmetsp:Transcript_84010/g.125932  ORF Transcript_84010/g.125932 Transcript_84010/m.125932 type:complete len:228 (-) Transcript_84010:95-778(-)
MGTRSTRSGTSSCPYPRRRSHSRATWDRRHRWYRRQPHGCAAGPDGRHGRHGRHGWNGNAPRPQRDDGNDAEPNDAADDADDDVRPRFHGSCDGVEPHGATDDAAEPDDGSNDVQSRIFARDHQPSKPSGHHADEPGHAAASRDRFPAEHDARNGSARDAAARCPTNAWTSCTRNSTPGSRSSSQPLCWTLCPARDGYCCTDSCGTARQPCRALPHTTGEAPGNGFP